MPIFSLLVAASCAGAPDAPLPQTLEPCPSSPNCVSTRADPTDEEHFIEPIEVRGAPEAFWTEVDTAIGSMKRVKRVDEGPDYRHYVFTTSLLRFKDDVQLELDRDEGLLHFRSASRVGHSDLGVNRRRMESLRKKLEVP